MGTRDNMRRPGLGAVLASICCGILACGGDGGDLSGPPPPVDEGVSPAAGCTAGVLEHGALYQICFPADWNGDIVLYAHGHVGADQELALPDQQFNGKTLSATLNDLRYAYAATSYRRNGLVGPEGVDDLVELEATVRKLYRPDPTRTVLVGVSEGGMIVGLAVERHPDVFDGALSACGPVGSLQGQLDYFDDFRVVFDYLFPGIIPGTAIEVPAEAATHWEDRYAPAVALALVTNPSAARELVRITGLPVERDDVVAIAVSAIAVLSYNVTGTADAQQRLGGQPFSNTTRVYSGSSDDAALNTGVGRFTADPAALASVGEFETTGSLQVPVATLHTTGDPVVPFGQEALYREKVDRAGSSTHLSQAAVDRFGHCTFEARELLGAFSTLVARIAPPLALRR
jgi:pimeloyl-ACP methyl ester carboxylesterase